MLLTVLKVSRNDQVDLTRCALVEKFSDKIKSEKYKARLFVGGLEFKKDFGNTFSTNYTPGYFAYCSTILGINGFAMIFSFLNWLFISLS